LRQLRVRRIGLCLGGNNAEYLVERMILDLLGPEPVLSVINRTVGPEPAANDWPEAVIAVAPTETVITDYAHAKRYIVVTEQGPYVLAVRDRLVPAANVLSRLYPFDGYVATGLWNEEGPWPQWNLPVVRWGLGPETRLDFYSIAGGPSRLVMCCRRNNDPAQALQVKLNGRVLLSRALGPSGDFQEMDIPFDARAGNNCVEISYRTWDTGSERRQTAVLYKKLQIVHP
jgi:hypothetical protein